MFSVHTTLDKCEEVIFFLDGVGGGGGCISLNGLCMDVPRDRVRFLEVLEP